MGKILVGAGFVLIAFLDYCCCRAASLAERRLERCGAEADKEPESKA